MCLRAPAFALLLVHTSNARLTTSLAPTRNEGCNWRSVAALASSNLALTRIARRSLLDGKGSLYDRIIQGVAPSDGCVAPLLLYTRTPRSSCQPRRHRYHVACLSHFAEEHMPNLLLRALPPDIHTALKRRASLNGRSRQRAV